VHVFLVITAVGCGGAERQIVWLGNRLVQSGHKVDLRTLHEGDQFFAIDHRVSVGNYCDDHRHASSAVKRFLSRPVWLREQIETAQPDVVLSFIDVANVVTLWAARTLDVPVVVAERVHPPVHEIPWQYALLRRWLYPKADGVVVQTEETANWAREWLSAERVVTIPNPVGQPSQPDVQPGRGDLPSGGHWLVAMGRLERQKGFDLLVAAFDTVAQDHCDWRLVILGDGGDRAQLESEIHRRGLDQRVFVLGSVEDPESILRACDIFVLSSRYEGFPNALCEAMAFGLPVISFDCPTGPSEIIRDRIDGMLVPAGDVAALAAAIGHLIENPDVAARIATRAPEVTERFNEGEVFTRWEELLVTTANGRVDSGTRRG
jgi:glycosyltransferase involved in cell wall biosynthesis